MTWIIKQAMLAVKAKKLGLINTMLISKQVRISAVEPPGAPPRLDEVFHYSTIHHESPLGKSVDYAVQKSGG
jgi:hypothetical protein